MFKHLFKLIWNKKKQNFLLITEMFISFIVMFAVFTLIVNSWNNYRKPMGFDYDNVWVITYFPPDNINDADSLQTFRETVRSLLKSKPQVEEVSFASNNVPFSMNTSNSRIGYQKKSVYSNFYGAEESYADVLGIQMEEGRWFEKGDRVSRVPPVVINSTLKQELFGNESPIGKILGQNDPGQPESGQRIIGVIKDIKDKGYFEAVENGLYRLMDSSWIRNNGTILVKVKASSAAALESEVFKSLSDAMGTSIEIDHLDKMLVKKNKVMIVPMIIGLIVAGFLIINVSLGLFGVLWYNINKRRGEIGLRRAVGATGNAVSRQLVSEALVLVTFALVVGLFFAVQFPILNVFNLRADIYVEAIALAVIFIYILVLICALYPGKQAAAIYPAVALHED